MINNRVKYTCNIIADLNGNGKIQPVFAAKAQR